MAVFRKKSPFENRARYSKKHLHNRISQTLLHLLPPFEASLEIAFTSKLSGKKHVADLVWHTQKIVFEIQCSPIDVSVLKARSTFYRSLGFDIIWVFHDKEFNRRFASPSELFARRETAYFTNINEAGIGIIYDQEEQFRLNRRIYRSAKIPIDISSPYLKGGLFACAGDHRLSPSYKKKRIFASIRQTGASFAEKLNHHYNKFLETLI